jgi:transcriptional regulator with XRE-family HTH domain
MDSKWFGGRLRELREQAGLTQGQLGKLAELSRNTVARLERGEHSATWETVVALAVALGVSCEAFMTMPADRTAAQQTRGRRPPTRRKGGQK